MYKHLLNQHNLFAESLGQEPLKKQQQPQHHFEHTSTMGAFTTKYLTFPKIPPFWSKMNSNTYDSSTQHTRKI